MQKFSVYRNDTGLVGIIRTYTFDLKPALVVPNGDKIVSLVLECESPPLRKDATGAIRVGNSRVLLELVIRGFQDGASPETIVQRYSTLSLSDVYITIGYYLRHQQEIESYLNEREQLAESVHQRFSEIQPDLSLIRSRQGYATLCVAA
ncbi:MULTISPECIES: DUF433 domain-containing protein [Planktothrix]|jgi:uncharacterized protein (DUF433 family)|nr:MULTISPECIES: hypothetical protein [Planktothrix]